MLLSKTRRRFKVALLSFDGRRAFLMFGFLIGLISTVGALAGRGSLWAGGATTLGQSPPTPKKEYIYSGDKLVAMEETTASASAPSAAPPNFTATTTSATQVDTGKRLPSKRRQNRRRIQP